ncbi:MAG: hypothetical protein Q8P41_29300 [Pseudomonadota bacterium]|nr:hypothetical protein [Pseudomonadota bacterium]
MRLLLPAGPPERLRAALTEAAELRRWWDPDATLADGDLSPGLDGPTLAIHADGDAVVWEGEGIRARFDLAGRTGVVEEHGGADVEDPDFAAGWALALAALEWALAAAGPVRWLRFDVPVALAYEDAWGRIVGPEGLAGADGPDGRRTVHIAGERYGGRGVVTVAPRAVALRLEDRDALVRLQVGPGESVNVARLELLVRGDTALPEGWGPWVARRFGMTWVAQLGEDG